MAKAYKVLAQSAPSATTSTDVYTVAASPATQVVISSIVIANRGGTATTYRIAIRPNGAALSNQHYIAYDSNVGANDMTALTLGITLDSSDVVTVYSGNANLSFNFFGAEIT